MEPEVINNLLNILLGGGGLGGLLIAWRTFRKHKNDDLPANEADARRTADWMALNNYFQAELKAVRAERTRVENSLRKEIADLREQFLDSARADAEFIDLLEQHIWLQLPPPPPRRRGPGAPPATAGP